MLQPLPSPQVTAQSVVSELQRLYVRRSAIDRLIQALEQYRISGRKMSPAGLTKSERICPSQVGA